jgi:hypothetical protein
VATSALLRSAIAAPLKLRNDSYAHISIWKFGNMALLASLLYYVEVHPDSETALEYKYTHGGMERQTDRKTDRQTDRKTDRRVQEAEVRDR